MTYISNPHGQDVWYTASMENEIWRPVLGAEGKYSVSNQGRVRSEARSVHSIAGPRPIPETIRVCAPNKYGYPIVDIYYLDGRRKTRVVHQLVMEAFVGPLPQGLVVCHMNGVKSDNRATNLRYDTVAENNRDLSRHGVQYFANRTHCPQGHPYDAVNTYVRKDRKGRECIACNRVRSQAAAERKKNKDAGQP